MLLLCALLSPRAARAQVAPAVGDTVRLRTLLAVVRGEVLFVSKDSLILAHRCKLVAGAGSMPHCSGLPAAPS